MPSIATATYFPEDTKARANHTTLARIGRELDALLHEADICGCVITVTTEPNNPKAPAMRDYRMVGEVRSARA